MVPGEKNGVEGLKQNYRLFLKLRMGKINNKAMRNTVQGVFEYKFYHTLICNKKISLY